MTIHDLPVLNAILNGSAAVLLVIAFMLIKQGRREAHKRVMLAAFRILHWSGRSNADAKRTRSGAVLIQPPCESIASRYHAP